MSNAWKWILGILAVLIVLGVVAAAVFVWWNRAPLAMSARVTRVQQYAQPVAWNARTAPGAPTIPNNQASPYGFGRGDRGFFQGPGGRMPMMGGRGYRDFGGLMPFGMGFFLLGGFLHLIIPLGVLVLVAILFYALGKRAGASTVASTPASNPTPPEPRGPELRAQGGEELADSPRHSASGNRQEQACMPAPVFMELSRRPSPGLPCLTGP